MTFNISLGQILGVVAGAAIVQGVIQFIGFMVFKAQASLWHSDNQGRFEKIEKALGLDDPDEVAFLRASDAVHIHAKLENHEGRIGVLERRPGNHSGR